MSDVFGLNKFHFNLFNTVSAVKCYGNYGVVIRWHMFFFGFEVSYGSGGLGSSPGK